MIDRSFFQRDPLTCARELVGCELIWKECAGIIVETEAYAEHGDEACHTFLRRSAREFIAKNKPGAAYVYINYGIHWLLNVLVKDAAGNNGFVLIRALEPTRGIERMQQRRVSKSKAELPLHDLCSGPGKLTRAFGIRGVEHGRDLCGGEAAEMIGFLPRQKPVELIADLRIGISKAAHLPWRFLLKESPFVSVRATGPAVAAAKTKFRPQQNVKQPRGNRNP